MISPLNRTALPILATLLVIVLLTLSPAIGEASRARSFCILCGDRGVADFALNLVLFSPLGLLLARAGLRPLLVIAVGVALSTSIELLQLIIPGRWPTLRDVFSNAAGCGLGALIYARTQHAIRLRARSIIFAMTFPSIAVAISGFLLVPVVTQEDIYGQWAPTLGRFETWTGVLTSASVGSVAVPSGRLRDNAVATRLALRETAPIHIVAEGAENPSSLAPIFAVADAQGNHLLLVGQRDGDLIVRRWLWSSRLRFDTPEVVFPRLLEGVQQGDPLTIDVVESATGSCAVANESTLCVRPPPVGSMWQFLVGGPRLQKFKSLLTAATLGALFLPLGMLMKALPPSRRWTLLAISVVLLLASAPIAGLASVRSVDLASVLLGSSIGMLITHKRNHSTRSHT